MLYLHRSELYLSIHQLPDELSESEIPANSSGIKNNFWTNCTEVIFVTIVSGFVPNWHEVISRQFGERCGIWYFTCFQIGKKSERRIFQNHLYPSWVQVQKSKKWISTCGRIDHKWHSENIPNLGIILTNILTFHKLASNVNLYRFTNSQAGQCGTTCRFCSSACWGNIPNPL